VCRGKRKESAPPRSTSKDVDVDVDVAAKGNKWTYTVLGGGAVAFSGRGSVPCLA
jgi:hypothetical protein